MNYILFILALIAIALILLMCWQESKKRKIHFAIAILICILTTPLFGYFIISAFALRNPIGCTWCGNTKNEAEYCGLCGKNKEGSIKILI
jgi:4-amino-4-deoxy-L-arabinose transferase-like glycosyltransferase